MRRAAIRARKKNFEPAEEQAEVVAGDGEHSVGAVAVAALQVSVRHAVLDLEVADHRIDRGPATPSSSGREDATQPACTGRGRRASTWSDLLSQHLDEHTGV